MKVSLSFVNGLISGHIVDENKIKSLIRQIDTQDNAIRERIWSELRLLGEGIVPYFAEFYPQAKKLHARRDIVFHIIGYTRTCEKAFQLGVLALNDKSSIVRYRACCAVAYSLRSEAIPRLEALLNHKDHRTAEDARAAIDAIENRNHNYFIDRGHTGKIRWHVNEDDGKN